MPHHGYYYRRGIDYGKGMYGHHPMKKTGGYGYSQPSASAYGMGQEDKSASFPTDGVSAESAVVRRYSEA